MIRARIKAALAVKVKRGEFTGVAPYGSRAGADGKTLESDPGERGILERVRALRETGMTFRGLQAAVTAEGLLSRSGMPFTLAALHKMARSFNVDTLSVEAQAG